MPQQKRSPFAGFPRVSRRAEYTPRMRRVAIWAAVGSLLLMVRACQLQLSRHEEFAALASRQSERVVRLESRRGELRDRFGRALALSVPAESIYAHPPLILDAQRSAAQLAKTLGQDPQAILRRLRSGRAFVWIQRQVSPQQAAAVHQLRLPGVGQQTEYKRVYPAGTLAGVLLGFTGIDQQGLEGLEYAYDSYLRGRGQLRVLRVDAKSRLRLGSALLPPPAGESLRLTLHPALQYLTENTLQEAVQRAEAVRGIAIVLRSTTGEILALAQSPLVDPNAYQEEPRSAFLNHALTSGYEPGSVLKLLTAAAVLQHRTIAPEERWYCEQGAWTHHDSVIHDLSAYGWLSMEDILRVSSNICAAKLGLSVPPEIFYRHLRSFRLGRPLSLFRSPSGKRLAAEASGYLPLANQWTPVDHAAISFGHGILVSPLQLVAAVNVFANEGQYIQPWLLAERRSPNGRIVQRGGMQRAKRILLPEVAREIARMMRVAVETGTGKNARLAGYAVAGKTGTTELYDIEAQGYSKTLHLASFVGFAPADAPQLTILVQIESPRHGRYGGVVAAPVFRRIAQRALPLLGVWPRTKTP